MSSNDDLRDAFSDVSEVVEDHLQFKAKLGIGDDAYTSIKLGKKIQSIWDVGGVAAGGATVAASSTVATTFFSSGLLTTLGIGTAVTPVGWVAAAAVMTGGAYFGVTRLFRGEYDKRVVTVPKFINTPIDLLGSRLFDLMAPLAVRIARIDGDYDLQERHVILDYFVHEWGISKGYAEAALNVVESADNETTINVLVEELALFKRNNPDCNYQVMTRELIGFLKEIAEADGYVDEREEMAIERVENSLLRSKRVSLGRAASETAGNVSKGVSAIWEKMRKSGSPNLE